MAFSSMDLDSSLDDVIKQRKKQNQKPVPAKKAAKQINQKKVPIKKIQTKAKVTKPNNNRNKKKNNAINARLGQKGPVSTASSSKKADPSQIIITKTIPVHKQKNHNNNNNNNHNHNNSNARNNNNMNNTIYSSNNSNSNRKNGFRMQQQPQLQQPQLQLQQPQPELFTSFKPPSQEPRAQFSIRGRSNTVTRPTGLTIRGESGPSTVLISNLDPRTNSEDVKVSCESFGAILHCEVLRNSSGQSYGEAEVEFSSKSAALDCIAQFDNNMADGRILRAILREPKPSMSSFASKQIRSSMPSFLPSGKMYADQIGNSRYDIHRP